ncbi:transposase [Roseivivax marinus]|uniref:Transposase n=1 Tax=Roseivivax marinus TaxID=1379903 RepID=W4HRT9_9RHOB|nr:transposase [Roseivivax marinus]
MGVVARIMEGLAAGQSDCGTIITDATYLKARQKASSLQAEKGGVAA